MAKISLHDDRTREELRDEKTRLEAEITTLSTKAGADAYIAARKAEVSPLLSKMKASSSGKITMADLLLIEHVRLNNHPDEVVSKEIVRLEKVVVDIDRSLSIDEEKP